MIVMRKHDVFVTAAVFAVFAMPVLAQNAAFSVSPSISVESGKTVLDVAFGVPEAHYLYADRIEVSASSPVELLPEARPLLAGMT